MKTRILSAAAAAIAATAMVSIVKADGALIYDSGAYAHAIRGYPNPAGSRTSFEPNVIYIDRVHGPALCSYPVRSLRHRVRLTESGSDAVYAVYAYATERRDR